jgi:hypothetical protein
MRGFVVVIAVALCVAIPAVALPLSSVQAFHTGAFACDGRQHYATWAVPGPLQVVRMELWMGMRAGGRGDFWVYVTDSHGNVWGQTNWDHYADPTVQHNLVYNYEPDWFAVQLGDTVTTRYGCTSMSWGNSGDVAMTVWWH